jgi:hypothetical protein
MNIRLHPCASHRRRRPPRSPSSASIASAAISASATSPGRLPWSQTVRSPGPSSLQRSRGVDPTSAAALLIAAIAVRGGRRRAARAVNAARIAVRSSRTRLRSSSAINAERPVFSPRARNQAASARPSGSRSTGRPRGSISVLTSANAEEVPSPGAGGGVMCLGMPASMLRRWGPPTRGAIRAGPGPLASDRPSSASTGKPTFSGTCV